MQKDLRDKGLKYCNTCKATKSLSEFHLAGNKNQPQLRKAKCSACARSHWHGKYKKTAKGNSRRIEVIRLTSIRKNLPELSDDEFAKLFRVPAIDVQDWLTGETVPLEHRVQIDYVSSLLSELRDVCREGSLVPIIMDKSELGVSIYDLMTGIAPMKKTIDINGYEFPVPAGISKDPEKRQAYFWALRDLVNQNPDDMMALFADRLARVKGRTGEVSRKRAAINCH